MKEYSKTHTSSKAADSHLRKLNRRGAISKVEYKGKKIILKYKFK